MLPVGWALLLLSAVPTAEPVRVIAPPWTVVEVKPDEAAFYTGRLAAELSRRGLQVTTSEDIAASLGVARQRELLGCAESSQSCLLELTNALGAEAILSGKIARLSGRLHLEVKVISQRSALPIAGATAEADSQSLMTSALPIVAEQLARGTLDRKAPPGAAQPLGAKRFAWMFGAGGGALLMTGGAFLVDAHLRHERLVAVGTTPLTETQARAELIGGQRSQALGWALGGAGAAALATAGALFLFGGDGMVRPTLAPASGGVELHLVGSLP